MGLSCSSELKTATTSSVEVLTDLAAFKKAFLSRSVIIMGIIRSIPFIPSFTGTPKQTSSTPSISPSRYALTVKIFFSSFKIMVAMFDMANAGPYSVAPFFLMT